MMKTGSNVNASFWDMQKPPKSKNVDVKPNHRNALSRKILGDIGNTFQHNSVTVQKGDQKAKNNVQKTQNKAQEYAISKLDEGRRYSAVCVAPYAQQVSLYMQETEHSYMVGNSFLNGRDVTARMRAILVDWMLEVHHRFKLNQETLFLAVNYLDRFLKIKCVKRNRLQLAGVTSLWIASKMEDIYQPEMRDFEFVTSNACTKKEIIEMEGEILEALNFKLVVPTAACFLHRFMQLCNVPPNSFVANMACFFLECTLGDVAFCEFRPSLLAIASLYLARKACKVTPHWTEEVETASGYKQQGDVRVPAKLLCKVVNDLRSSPYQAVRIKYSSEQFKAVAKEVVPGPVPSSSEAGRCKAN